MVGSLDDWMYLATPGGRELMLTISPDSSASQIDRLRKRWSPPQVAAAMELAIARRKAQGKLHNADTLFADAEGVEQASSAAVAQHKAERFAAIRPDRIFDLCCGIGGDAAALKQSAPVIGVDLNPIRAWMMEMNTGCQGSVEDLSSWSGFGEVIHIDPARRSGGRRVFRWADYQPSPEVLLNVLQRNPNSAVKLGPGVNLDEMPIGPTDEVEFISDNRTLVQCIWWRGRLAFNPGGRTATLISDSKISPKESLTGTLCALSNPDRWEMDAVGALGSYLHIADPSIERAGLLETLERMIGGRSVHAGLGWITSDHLVQSPWVSSFLVRASMPWRIQKVKSWLELHNGGWVEVKCRGVEVNTDEVQRELSGRGANRFVVLVYRRGRIVESVVAQRTDSGYSGT